MFAARLISVMALLLIGCAGFRPRSEPIPEREVLAGIRSHGCAGWACPVYEWSVLSSGRLVFRGLQHSASLGLFERKLDPSQMSTLVEDVRLLCRLAFGARDRFEDDRFFEVRGAAAGCGLPRSESRGGNGFFVEALERVERQAGLSPLIHRRQ